MSAWSCRFCLLHHASSLPLREFWCLCSVNPQVTSPRPWLTTLSSGWVLIGLSVSTRTSQHIGIVLALSHLRSFVLLGDIFVTIMVHTSRVVMKSESEPCQTLSLSPSFLWLKTILDNYHFDPGARTTTHGPWLQTLGVPSQMEITVAFSAAFTGLSQLWAWDKKSLGERRRNPFVVQRKTQKGSVSHTTLLGIRQI